MTLEYIAGFFDGEGSVGVYHRKGKGFHLRTQLCQNKSKHSTRLFLELQRRFGGNLSHHASPSRKPYYNWQLNSDTAVHFLEEILPHLVLKKDQAKLAVQWQRSRPPRIRDKRGRIVPAFKLNVRRSIQVSNRLKEMKRAQ